MANVIVYKQDNGVVAIVHPTDEALSVSTIQDIALRDVPTGKKFKIIDSSLIPADRSQRNAWTIDDVELTDGVGA